MLKWNNNHYAHLRRSEMFAVILRVQGGYRKLSPTWFKYKFLTNFLQIQVVVRLNFFTNSCCFFKLSLRECPYRKSFNRYSTVFVRIFLFVHVFAYQMFNNAILKNVVLIALHGILSMSAECRLKKRQQSQYVHKFFYNISWLNVLY